MSKPILCVDFDGVIHWYRNGWQDGVIYDEPVPGSFAFLEAASKQFKICIYSSRSKTEPGRIAMVEWFMKHLNTLNLPQWYKDMDFSKEKPPAFLTIDDRAHCFDGTWPDVDALRVFKPWNVK